MWKGDQCIQTITHPAISVWSVAVCKENGDIVTGASDRVVRIFSRSKDRQAAPDSIRAFDDAVKSSSIPQQQVGNINKEQLPGPEFLQQKSGTKEGQVQMIREPNGNVSAHQWSTAANQWINVGTVVDAAGSSGRKISHKGKDYDYVFDVDIAEGAPPLKLPYNLSHNPYEAARKFIDDNELSVNYLDQVANFIVSNTQGATIGRSSNHTEMPGADPWGSGSRYRPGEVDAPAPANQPAESRPKMLPQTQYLSIATANLKTIQRKIEEINQQLIDQGSKDVSLNPSDLHLLAAMIKQLEQTTPDPDADSPPLIEGVDVAMKIATAWPRDKRLPGLDLLRLLAAASPSVAIYTSSGDQTFIDVLASSGVFDAASAPPNNTMLAVRALANLFTTEQGRFIADGEFDKVHELIHPFVEAAINNRNLIIAITTLYINYAVQLTAPSHNADRALTLLDDLTTIINQVTDSEALYRALVGAGTLCALGEDFRTAAKEVFGFDAALKRAESVGKEPRIRSVVGEMRDELGA